MIEALVIAWLLGTSVPIQPGDTAVSITLPPTSGGVAYVCSAVHDGLVIPLAEFCGPGNVKPITFAYAVPVEFSRDRIVVERKAVPGDACAVPKEAPHGR